MNPTKPSNHPKLFGLLPALGLSTSIAFAIAASVVSSVARAAESPQCPAGQVLNVQTQACVPVKPPTAPATAKPAAAPATAPVIKALAPPMHLPPPPPPAAGTSGASGCSGASAGPSGSSGGSCSYSSVSPVLATAASLGTVNMGSCIVKTGGPLSDPSVPQDWYRITVQAPVVQSGRVVNNASAYPRIYLSAGAANYAIDVLLTSLQSAAATDCVTGMPAQNVANFVGAATAKLCTLPNSPQTLWVNVHAFGTNSGCVKYTLNVSD